MRLFVILSLIMVLPLWSRAEESSQSSEKRARSKYFGPGKQATASSVSNEDHYLALHFGGFVGGDAYKWGDTSHLDNSPGKLSIGLTYRVGPMGDLADWLFRMEFNSYELPEGRPVQVVVEPIISFPDASSKFPLYFGVGLGPGFFFKQVTNESFLALNYTVLAGARLMNLVGNTGFFLEGGLKNHFLLLSDGQFNGYFVTAGAVFVF